MEQQILSKKEQLAEEKKVKFETELKTTVVQTLKGRTTLAELFDNPGVKNRIEYYNSLQVKTPLKLRTGTKDYMMLKDITHGYGLIFNDGFELKHISKNVFNNCLAEIIKIRERNPTI